VILLTQIEIWRWAALPGMASLIIIYMTVCCEIVLLALGRIATSFVIVWLYLLALHAKRTKNANFNFFLVSLFNIAVDVVEFS